MADPENNDTSNKAIMRDKHKLLIIIRRYIIYSVFLMVTGCNLPGSDNTNLAFFEPDTAFEVNVPSFPDEIFNVMDFGAMGNGVELDTEAIQKAIDHCAASNGGTVHFPPGVFLSGTLFLSSYVNIHLDKGAILLGSHRLEDYPETIPELRSYTDNYTVRSLIYAEGKHNIAITGEGIIDGQGAKFPVVQYHYKSRPYIIRMVKCTNILIEDITILNSPMWVQHYLACDHLTIDNITVSSRYANHNNDGIDIDACHNVNILNSNIDSEDDAIVFKSTMSRSCENILVENCTVSSIASGIKFGTESNGGFRNIIIRDCHIYNTRRSALALEIVDGGSMENIYISDITMDNVRNPIFVRLGNRARPYRENMPAPDVGSLKNVTIRNVRATNMGYFWEDHPYTKFPRVTDHIPSSISGLPGHPVENILLENVHIEYSGGMEQPFDASTVIPEAEQGYPEYNMFGQLPASGFYVRNAKNVKFSNVHIETAMPDSRKKIYLDKNTTNIFKDGILIDISMTVRSFQ
jgi:polygalacturonase